ncbi:hypothetical protein QFZ81_000110 [Paenibacillus sp. V4I9]|uniref:C1 family peptidase n=1 Tax=Paenibacillus sp. V4I9 TaxID=3042308 RepID=UPI002788542E|nr:C1 family peptidase [Paenibacillus sp. V4I9]MDQ0885022.1 hypothetical protein [Paenibacillus sp. V4I9]
MEFVSGIIGLTANNVGNPDSKADGNARTYLIKSYVCLDTLDSMKISLLINGPFVMGVPVFENWSNNEVRATGIIPQPDNTTSSSGHAICIVGYDDNKRMFKFKNSWGTEWGEAGYGYLPYEYSSQSDSEACSAMDVDLAELDRELNERILHLKYIPIFGNPVILQSRFGNIGNFELITPLVTGGLAHYWRNNDDPHMPWNIPSVFATGLGRIDALTFIQSNFGDPGNFEVFVRTGVRLATMWRDSQTHTWSDITYILGS